MKVTARLYIKDCVDGSEVYLIICLSKTIGELIAVVGKKFHIGLLFFVIEKKL